MKFYAQEINKYVFLSKRDPAKQKPGVDAESEEWASYRITGLALLAAKKVLGIKLEGQEVKTFEIKEVKDD